MIKLPSLHSQRTCARESKEASEKLNGLGVPEV